MIYLKGFSKKYLCFNCGQKINPRYPKCPYCKKTQPIELRAEALDNKIVNIECKECGCKTSFLIDDEYSRHTSCTDCGKTTSYDDTGKESIPIFKTRPTIKCPYCNSTNTKKISTMSKATSFALFGFLSVGKVTKQWHCNNCKSDF